MQDSPSYYAENLMEEAIRQHASDIHFTPEANEISVYIRIHGKRILHSRLSAMRFRKLIAYYKFVSGMDIGEMQKPQDGAMPFSYKGQKQYSLRLSTLPLKQTESLAIRILPQSEAPLLDQLFLFPFQIHKLRQLLVENTGILLFTGPTGSGKTTTMYALLQDLLQMKAYQAITLEDPIEKRMENMLQVQVNEKAGLTYQAGLKAALRHDPDVLMIGEIRDESTASFAFETARTGHLVISTLHAKNAAGAIHRLREMGIPEADLQHTLIGVASLELLPVTAPRSSRAAIMELADSGQISCLLKAYNTSFLTFAKLRRKAYAYGFITEENYQVQEGRQTAIYGTADAFPTTASPNANARL
ncbi:competence protein ComGA [Terribacillus halophilus]|uniref:Competence protein ComGA n=1 Tax=Terribacillus halophilus TaxID=361279 RepID=A0A1G6VK05_9BACI|nr:competence type IV pilus ATPase ComGA [Terribacillus halophilus]SDD53854.1 competence protein ComGA [Terribacillus halophilus]